MACAQASVVSCEPTPLTAGKFFHEYKNVCDGNTVFFILVFLFLLFAVRDLKLSVVFCYGFGNAIVFVTISHA